MMKFFFKLSGLLSLLILLLSSCKKDNPDIEQKGAYEKTGLFIIAEGIFQSGTGTVHFYDSDTEMVHDKIFQMENNGAVIGNLLQSATIFDDKAFLVVNNAGKVEVVQHSDFASVGTITGLSQPRYLVEGSEHRAYVSQWDSGAGGQVKVLDVSNLSVSDSITDLNGPEQMLVANDQLYVVNSGGYGADSMLSIFNTIDLSEVAALDVGGCPTRIIQSDDDVIWVMAGGCYDSNWVKGNGHLSKVEHNMVTQKIEFQKGPIDNLAESPDGTMLFLASTDGIYRFDKATLSFEEDPVIAGSFYGMTIGASAKKLVASKTNYVDNDIVFIYDLTDENEPILVDSIAGGILSGELFWQE